MSKVFTRIAGGVKSKVSDLRAGFKVLPSLFIPAERKLELTVYADAWKRYGIRTNYYDNLLVAKTLRNLLGTVKDNVVGYYKTVKTLYTRDGIEKIVDKVSEKLGFNETTKRELLERIGDTRGFKTLRIIEDFALEKIGLKKKEKLEINGREEEAIIDLDTVEEAKIGEIVRGAVREVVWEPRQDRRLRVKNPILAEIVGDKRVRELLDKAYREKWGSKKFREEFYKLLAENPDLDEKLDKISVEIMREAYTKGASLGAIVDAVKHVFFTLVSTIQRIVARSMAFLPIFGHLAGTLGEASAMLSDRAGQIAQLIRNAGYMWVPHGKPQTTDLLRRDLLMKKMRELEEKMRGLEAGAQRPMQPQGIAGRGEPTIAPGVIVNPVVVG